MDAFICSTCGTQYPPADAPLPSCAICTDARQYVPLTGQAWTTLDKLRLSHQNYYRRLQPDLYAIATQPKLGIGQRALLSGDILQVVPDRRHVAFMWSYPNYIPLPAFTLREMAARLAPFDYDAVFGAFWDAEITQGGKAAVAESFRRTLSMMERGTLE